MVTGAGKQAEWEEVFFCLFANLLVLASRPTSTKCLTSSWPNILIYPQRDLNSIKDLPISMHRWKRDELWTYYYIGHTPHCMSTAACPPPCRYVYSPKWSTRVYFNYNWNISFPSSHVWATYLGSVQPIHETKQTRMLWGAVHSYPDPLGLNHVLMCIIWNT